VRYRLAIQEETTTAWLRVRERISSPGAPPVIAVSGMTECVAGNKLHSTAREVAYPMRNPWFSGEVSELHGEIITLVNASERPARASGCYSSGGLFSRPTRGNPTPELEPVCSATFGVQIPPFGTRQFPVERDGNTHFSLRTQGAAIVLQMLHDSDAGVKLYTVGSKITFGEEVPAAVRKKP
jgi:xanthosine utilization system XapX-like protein